VLRENRYLLLAFLAAVATGLFTYAYLAQLDRRVEVVVAAAAVPQYARLDTGTVKVVRLPVQAVHPDAVLRLEDALGRHVLVPSEPGEQILRSKLAGSGRDARFVARLGPEERAMMVPVGLAQGAGGAVRPGDRVDVVFVTTEHQSGFALARTLLYGVTVLDVRNDQGRSATERDAGQPAGVVLAVSPGQAERLAFAMENGRLYLSLSGYTAVEVQTPGVTWETLFASDPPPVVAGEGNPGGAPR